MLDCPGLSKDRTIRRKVSENSLQGSVSVKKKFNIIEMTFGALLWDIWNSIWVIQDGSRNIKGTNESFPLLGSFIHLMHHDLHQLGSLIQVQSCPESLCFFSQQCQTKKITGSGNDIDLDPDHPKERHPYSQRNARKPTLDYCTYLPGKTLPKESRDPADNLYPCYSWRHCILHMKVSVEMRPQLWRTRNRNHNVKLFYNIKFGHPTTLTILKWHFEW